MNTRISLSVVGCWTLTLTEERRLRVFGNSVLKKILGPKRDEVIGDWRISHNDDVYDSFSSPHISRVISQEQWDEGGMWYLCSGGEVHNGFCGETVMNGTACETKA